MSAGAQADARAHRIDARAPWERRAPAAVFLLACATYLNTLANGFTLDDVPLVRENPLVQEPGRWLEILRSHYWAASPWVADHGLYRPVTIGSYALVHALCGPAAWAQHALNVLLHGLACLLLFLWLRRVAGSALIAAAVALAFALHPIHTEAVAGIVGRAELLAFVGAFGCLVALERARTQTQEARAWVWILLAAACFALALLSKETGVLALGIWLWSEVVFPERRWLLRGSTRALWSAGLLAGVLALIAVVRADIVGERWSHPGWIGVPTAERVWTALRVVGEYLGLLVWPKDLLAEYGVHDVPIAHSISAALPAILALLVLAALGLWAWRRAPLVTFGLGLFALSLAPVSNVLFPIGVMKAERLLYLPSAGILIAALGALQAWCGRPSRQRVLPVTAGLLLALLAARTWARNGDWRDNRTIALSIEKISPNSPTLNTNLALWYQERGQLKEARAALLKALAAEPQRWQTHSFLGDVELGLGDARSARARYEEALRLLPEHAPLYVKLAQALVQCEDWPAAARALAQVRARIPDGPAGWLNSMAVLVRAGDAPAAARCAEEATQRFPGDARVWNEAAAAFRAAGDVQRAAAAAERARSLSAAH